MKQYESKEQVHKTTCRETSVFHDLTYNRQFISKIETNSSFSVYWNLFTVLLDCILELDTAVSA